MNFDCFENKPLVSEQEIEEILKEFEMDKESEHSGNANSMDESFNLSSSPSSPPDKHQTT